MTLSTLVLERTVHLLSPALKGGSHHRAGRPAVKVKRFREGTIVNSTDSGINVHRKNTHLQAQGHYTAPSNYSYRLGNR